MKYIKRSKMQERVKLVTLVTLFTDFYACMLALGQIRIHL